MDAYARLKEVNRRISALSQADGMLDWDAAVCLPRGGSGQRGEQRAALAGVIHSLSTDPRIGDDLAEAAAAGLGEWDLRNLGLMRRDYVKATALPAALVERQVSTASACEAVWRDARPHSDFTAVTPLLTELVALARERGEALGPALGLGTYDALMDDYQPGVTSSDVTAIFDSHRAFLSDFIPAVLERQASRGAPPTRVPASEAVQEETCRRLSERAGLDFQRARLDRSAHPFCSGTRDDVRITTRYDTEDMSCAVFGVLHETGHAIYEQDLPPEWAGQPVGASGGMGIHESQSLIVEMQAALSDGYLRWLAADLASCPGINLAAGADALISAWRRVEPGFIRVEADEVTYPAHVMLRFDLERALVSGDLSVRDLPGAWNDGMKGFLGIVPPDDRRGVLQDIHWYCNLFGYFPSYTLGAMAAAQMMSAARSQAPGIDGALATGSLLPLIGWLRQNVHAWGSFHGFDGLLEASTGSKLDPTYFQDHLRARYLD